MTPRARNVRLIVGPANMAGQAFQWARAARVEGVAAQSFSFEGAIVGRVRSGFRFDVDHRLAHHRLATPLTRRLSLERVERGFTHLAASGFGRLGVAANLGADLEYFADRGVRVALIAHGSDVRSPDRHRELVPWSYYNDAPDGWVRLLASEAHANRKLANEAGVPVFVSTPDLLAYLPEAKWLPVTTDVATWQTRQPPLMRARPVVLHVPSRRAPAIKGTKYIDPVLRRMHSAGAIEYSTPVSASHTQMIGLVRNADVVIDQVQSGFYGVAAVEALAASRVVIGSVGDSTRGVMDEPPPIVDVTPDHIEDVVYDVISNRPQYQQLAEAGPDFAARWHDGRAAVAALREFLNS